MSEESGRLQWIDSLKGIAVCSIVWVHIGGGNTGCFFDFLGQAGAYWVELFFIISVYFACISLRKLYDGGKDECTFKNRIKWFSGKIWKLLPLYYLALLAYLFIIPSGANIWLGTERIKPGILNILAHLFCLHGFFPYYANSIMWVEWYLGSLVIYLALCPILCRYIRDDLRAGKLTVLFVFLSVLATSILGSFQPVRDQYIWEGWVYTYSFIVHLPSVAYGILLYYLKDRKIKNIYLKLAFISALIGYVVMAYISTFFAEFPLIWVIRTTGFASVFFLMILSKKTQEFFLLDNGIWRIIGRHTYGIYLFHFLLVFMVGNLISDEVAVSIIHSPIIWKLIEFVFVLSASLLGAIFYDRMVAKRIYGSGL